MIYNPFMPSVRFSDRAVFGGGGAAPLAGLDAETLAPVTENFAAKAEEERLEGLTDEERAAEEEKKKKEKLEKEQTEEFNTANTSATKFAEDVTSDVSGSAEAAQGTVNKLQLELQQLQSNLKEDTVTPEKEAEYAEKLKADPSFVRPVVTQNPQIEAEIKAKQEELNTAQQNRASIGGVQAQGLMTAQAGLVTDAVTDPTKIVQKQDVAKIDADAAGTNIDASVGQLGGSTGDRWRLLPQEEKNKINELYNKDPKSAGFEKRGQELNTLVMQTKEISALKVFQESLGRHLPNDTERKELERLNNLVKETPEYKNAKALSDEVNAHRRKFFDGQMPATGTPAATQTKGTTIDADTPTDITAKTVETTGVTDAARKELEGGVSIDGDAMLAKIGNNLPKQMTGATFNKIKGVFEYKAPTDSSSAQAKDMLKRIMSEKDNMALDFNKNGKVTPEDARAWLEANAETIEVTPEEMAKQSGISLGDFTSQKEGLTAAKGEVSEGAQATAQQGVLSVGAAAEAFGVDKAFIEDIKSGKRTVSPEEIAEAAKRSGTPEAEIQKMLAPYKDVEAAKFGDKTPEAVAQDVYNLTPTQIATQTATAVQDAAKVSEYPTAEAAQSDFKSTLEAAQGSVGGNELVNAKDIIATAKAVQAVAATDKALNEESIAIAAQGSFSQAALAKAAQGTVPPSATVQGQMEDLMSQFDDGTPVWAAGAMRAANAAMAARGMGASSMASSAIIQAAMESAIPIAAQDAQTFQQMNMTNLNNQQQVSLANAAAQQNMELSNLSNRQQTALQNSSNSFALQSQNLSNTQAVVIANAQFKSALQNKTLDIKTQTSLANASKYAEINQINLNNRQQVNLQKSSENLQVDMANLSNEQQTGLSNLQVRAALVGQELTNEQQMAVLESTQDFERAGFDASAKQKAFLQDAQSNAALEGKAMDIRQQTQLFNVSAELEERKIELNNEQQTTLFNSTNKLNVDLAELSNRQQTALANAQIDAALTGQELTNQQQVNVLKTERFAEAANLTFTAEQTAILHKSDLIKTISIAELSGKNTAALQNAATIAAMDTTNLNARQQAEVLNAKSFLAMDMANLDNEQQTSIFKAQAIQQALLTDAAADNATKQFNASSENQTNQFMASINTQVSQFNATQKNAMSEFNAGESNAISTFNAGIKNQRDEFNATNALIVAQANAQWRQNTGTINTAAQNTANATAAATANGYTASVVDQIWQRERDMMAFVFTAADNEQERMTRLLLGDKDLEEVRLQMEATLKAARKTTQGEIFGKMLGVGGDGPCCFIMLEARYGDGTMDKVVRRYRDEYMTDRNRRGYYKLAEVLVPLMRKSKAVKWIVTKTFADPLVSYGKYHYGQNKYGVLYSPVKSFWMKIFDTLGGKTEFIRENGEVV